MHEEQRWQRRDFLRMTAGASLVAAFPAPSLWAALAGDPAADLAQIYAGLQLYWGDIHGHTGFSDGYGTPRVSYEYARRQRGLHFAAVTDHIEWVRHFETRLNMQDGSPLPLWADTVAEAVASTVPGTFVALPAFEWTNDTHGHRNILFRSPDDVPEVPPTAVTHRDPPALWEALAPFAAMTIPHHPTRWGHLMNWDYYNPALDRLVEIYSKWGNGASVWTPYDAPTAYRRNPAWRQVAEASGVDQMLLRGYEIGIIAGSDSHQGQLGSTVIEPRIGKVLPRSQQPTTGEQFLSLLDQGYRVDEREPSGGAGGLAAVWAPALNREAVWDALYDRCAYGTTGIRPAVRFGARETQAPSRSARMGASAQFQSAPRLLVSVATESGSRATELQLLRNNTIIKKWSHPAAGATLSFDDTGLKAGQTGCYRCLVLVRQEQLGNLDGDRKLVYDNANDRFYQSGLQRDEQVWTSPIWIKRTA